MKKKIKSILVVTFALILAIGLTSVLTTEKVQANESQDINCWYSPTQGECNVAAVDCICAGELPPIIVTPDNN